MTCGMTVGGGKKKLRGGGVWVTPVKKCGKTAIAMTPANAVEGSFPVCEVHCRHLDSAAGRLGRRLCTRI